MAGRWPARTPRSPGNWWWPTHRQAGRTTTWNRPGPAKDARPWPAAVRWFFLICLILFLILVTIGQLGVVYTLQSTDLHATMVGVSWLSIFGALLFLVLFECARKRFTGAQLGWAVVPLLSWGLLASVPFLWLALVRRRVRDWVVSLSTWPPRSQ
jgi:hypothetical protein